MFDYQIEKALFDKIATAKTYEFVNGCITKLIKFKGESKVCSDVKRDKTCEVLDYLTHLIEIGNLEVLKNSNLLNNEDLRKCIFHSSIVINYTIGKILNKIDTNTCPDGLLFNYDSLEILMGRTYRIFLEHEVDEKLISGSVYVFLIEPITQR